MNLQEAVDFYHSLLRFGVQPGLERIRALLNRLDNPQSDLQYVHVAGTNGKGTTCTLIASVLTAAGYKTGLYTSPYVIDFRERIQLNGKMLPEKDLISVTQRVKQEVAVLNRQGIYPTEFEAITAAAFLYYKMQHCHIVVLEVGLGGAYDATNVIQNPLASVLVSISLDHVKVLGNTVEEIAREKCGIIKPNCPVVTSVHQLPGVLEIIRSQAKLQKSDCFVINPEKEFKILQKSIFGTRVGYGDNELLIPFTGAHQVENASLCVAVLQILQNKGFAIDTKAMQTGFETAEIPARTEIISKEPLVILDGSHNDGSTAALQKVLAEFLPDKKILCVIGMMADKDVDTALRHLMPHICDFITVTPSNKRAMAAQELAEKINQNGKKAVAVPSPVQAVQTAFKQIKHYDALLVCGSLYLAADVRRTLTEIVLTP